MTQLPMIEPGGREDKQYPSAVFDVDPTRATAWLARNKHNRTLREGKVAAYARDMETGNWRFNGDPIRFAEDGTLLDGQHRLNAVIRSGVVVKMLVIFGLPAEAQDTMDLGARRTTADALRLRGEQHSKFLAAIARRALLFDKGSAVDSGKNSPTNAEMLAYIDSHPGIRRAAEVAERAAHAVPVAPSVVGASYHICSRLDVPSAELFWVTSVIDGIGLREGDAALVLLRRWRKEETSGRRMHPDDAFRYALLAWNHFRAGNSISKLQAPKNGWGPYGVPVPR